LSNSTRKVVADTDADTGTDADASISVIPGQHFGYQDEPKK